MVDSTKEPLYVLRRICHWKWKLYLCFLWHICEFYTIRSMNIFCIGAFIYIYSVHEWFYHSAIIISVFLLVGLFLIYLCMHWYVCVFFKIYSLIPINIRNLVLYLSCDWVILPPCCCYIFLKLMCLCILWKCSQRYVCVLYTNP